MNDFLDHQSPNPLVLHPGDSSVLHNLTESDVFVSTSTDPGGQWTMGVDARQPKAQLALEKLRTAVCSAMGEGISPAAATILTEALGDAP